MRKAADSAWKDLLDRYFEQFFAFLCPEVTRISTGAGRRRADKLVRV